ENSDAIRTIGSSAIFSRDSIMRCKERTQMGGQCRRQSAKGSKVCYQHCRQRGGFDNDQIWNSLERAFSRRRYGVEGREMIDYFHNHFDLGMLLEFSQIL